MENIKKEKFLENSVGPIFIKSAEIIISQMRKCLCKIMYENSTSTGFFCKIPYPDMSHLLPILVTTDFAIENGIKKGVSFNISINEDQEFKTIKIDDNRKIFINELCNAAFIELTPEDKINDFLEIDYDIFQKENYAGNAYRNKSIYVLHYPKGQIAAMNPGIFKHFLDDKGKFSHLCSTACGSSGGPILLLDNFKVIGFHTSSNDHMNYNIGTFIKYPIEEFIKSNIGKINNYLRLNIGILLNKILYIKII